MKRKPPITAGKGRLRKEIAALRQRIQDLEAEPIRAELAANRGVREAFKKLQDENLETMRKYNVVLEKYLRVLDALQTIRSVARITESFDAGLDRATVTLPNPEPPNDPTEKPS